MKVIDNFFKVIVQREVCPLSPLEKINFAKSLIWFGNNNLKQIIRWFLPLRSLKFIQKYLQDNQNLIGDEATQN